MSSSIAPTDNGRAVADELVRFLVGQPTAVATLLAEHVDDGFRHCRACAIGGQRGYLVWPCLLYEVAVRAAAALSAADTEEQVWRAPLSSDPPAARASRVSPQVRNRRPPEPR